MDRTAILPCGARPRAPATHYPLPPSPSSLEKDIRGPFVSIRGSIICPFVFFVVSVLPYTRDARRFCRAGRAHARQPRTALFSLLPTPYYCHLT